MANQPTIRIPAIAPTSLIENDDIMLISKWNDAGQIEKTTTISTLKKNIQSPSGITYEIISEEDDLPNILLEANSDFTSDFRKGDTIKFLMTLDTSLNSSSITVKIKKDNSSITDEYLLYKKIDTSEIEPIEHLIKDEFYEFTLYEDGDFDNLYESAFVLNSVDWKYKIEQQSDYLKITTTVGHSPRLHDGFKIRFKCPITLTPAKIVFDNDYAREVYNIEDINTNNPSILKFYADDYYELVYIDSTWYRTNSEASSIGVEYEFASGTVNSYTLTPARGIAPKAYYHGMVIVFLCIGVPTGNGNMQVRIGSLENKRLIPFNFHLTGSCEVLKNFAIGEIITAYYDEDGDGKFLCNLPQNYLDTDRLYKLTQAQIDGSAPKPAQIANEVYKLVEGNIAQKINQIVDTRLVVIKRENEEVQKKIITQYAQSGLATQSSGIQTGDFILTEEGTNRSLAYIETFTDNQTITIDSLIYTNYTQKNQTYILDYSSKKATYGLLTININWDGTTQTPILDLNLISANINKLVINYTGNQKFTASIILGVFYSSIQEISLSGVCLNLVSTNGGKIGRIYGIGFADKNNNLSIDRIHLDRESFSLKGSHNDLKRGSALVKSKRNLNHPIDVSSQSDLNININNERQGGLSSENINIIFIQLGYKSTGSLERSGFKIELTNVTLLYFGSLNNHAMTNFYSYDYKKTVSQLQTEKKIPNNNINAYSVLWAPLYRDVYYTEGDIHYSGKIDANHYIATGNNSVLYIHTKTYDKDPALTPFKTNESIIPSERNKAPSPSNRFYSSAEYPPSGFDSKYFIPLVSIMNVNLKEFGLFEDTSIVWWNLPITNTIKPRSLLFCVVTNSNTKLNNKPNNVFVI